MSQSIDGLVLPRPGSTLDSTQSPIPGPTEAAFTQTFGTLLPPASFLNTTTGKAAYYEILPSSPGGDSSDTLPSRVLFVHGVQTPALGMLPLTRALQTSFPRAHLVLVDLWGHGLSDTPIVPHSADLFHQLLDALLDRLGWDSAHLVSFSFGGAITPAYVSRRVARIESFTLVAPAGLLRSSDLSAEEQGHMRGDDEAAARKWVLEWLEGGELVVPADWRQRVDNGEVVAEAVREWQMHHHPGHVASVVAIVRDGGVFDTYAEFAKVARTAVPSLVVLGELDDLCTEQQVREHGFTNVSVIPQVGHGVVRDRAAEVAALVGDFWTKLAATTAS